MAQQQQQQQPASVRLECFLKYNNFRLVTKSELNQVMDYINSNLSVATNKYEYWYDMYNYCIKNYIVLAFKEKNNQFPLLTILGECVCQDEVINFLKNTNKKCFCDEGCASVYYNVVF